MVVTMNTNLKNTILNDVKTALDGGGVGATMAIYTGTKPAGPDSALSGNTLLGTVTCSYPCGTVSSGTLTFSSVAGDTAADASGTATWARISTGGGSPVAVMDVDATTTAGNGYLKMNTTTVVAGGPIVVTSMVLTL